MEHRCLHVDECIFGCGGDMMILLIRGILFLVVWRFVFVSGFGYPGFLFVGHAWGGKLSVGDGDNRLGRVFSNGRPTVSRFRFRDFLSSFHCV
jgi:hypothetical protein